MLRSEYYQSAVELSKMLARHLDRTMLVVSAKQEFCGATRPINDFHSAMVVAENSGLIAYSRDYLSSSLNDRAVAVMPQTPSI